MLKKANHRSKTVIHKNYYVLYFLIFLLMALAGFLYFRLYLIDDFQNQSIKPADNGDKGETVSLPSPIKKTDEVLKAEQTLEVVREIEKTDSGEIKIKAYLKNINAIENDLILEDFVETIRFGQKVEIEKSDIKALNGYLFPPGEQVNISNYGPGPISSKSTRFDIAVLELNFTNESVTTGLYELTFKSDRDITEIHFDGAEISSEKSIITLAPEKRSL